MPMPFGHRRVVDRSLVVLPKWIDAALWEGYGVLRETFHLGKGARTPVLMTARRHAIAACYLGGWQMNDLRRHWRVNERAISSSLVDVEAGRPLAEAAHALWLGSLERIRNEQRIPA